MAIFHLFPFFHCSNSISKISPIINSRNKLIPPTSLLIPNRFVAHTLECVPPYYLADIVAGSINSLHPLLPEFSRGRCVTTSAVSTSFGESRSPSCSREGEATILAFPFHLPRRELSRPCNIVADIVSTRNENWRGNNGPTPPPLLVARRGEE